MKLYHIDDFLSKDSPCMMIDGDRYINRTEFLEDVTALAFRLHTISAQRIALCFTSAYRFSVAFFASLSVGKTPVLLPNNLAGTISALSAEYDLVVSEDTDLLTLSNGGTIKASDDFKLAELRAEQPFIIFSSGSSGQPKQINRTLGVQLNEINALSQTFEPLNELVLTTVSHQHLYGLLFSLLWPMLAGSTIYLTAVLYPEDLIKIRQQQQKAVTLISSPAFLSRLSNLTRLTMRSNGDLMQIFSSGGLLKAKAEQTVYGFFQTDIIEIFGSSETGILAWRRRRKAKKWQPFKDVNFVVKSKQLCVSSPYFEARFQPMADRIRRYRCGGFTLLGRVDRIVKIEDKRLSLAQLEKRLEAIDEVDHCYALTMEAHRQYSAAVIVLSKEGWQRLAQMGTNRFNRHLRDWLSAYFDRIVVPRRFRYVEQLPVNTQGKLQLSQVKALFEKQEEDR
ncbi:MAG: AMP-binding protein [Francisellaceae bacterium]